jgi:phenylacetate-CoA ligase
MTTPTFPSRDAIEADQLERLRELVRSLVPANRFYTPLLRAAGLDREVRSLEHFRGLPFTTKQQIADDQRAHPPFGSNLTFPLTHYTRFHQTSGSTASPLRWLDTQESWQWMLGNWRQVYEAAGVTRDDRICFAFSFGPFLGFWTAFEAAQQIGGLCIPGGGLSSAARLRLILDNDCTVLCCTPTYALRLAEVAAEEHIDLSRSKVRLIMVAGEPGGSSAVMRSAIGKAWHGARVFDHHGMTEVGPVSLECPARAGVLHIIESSYIAEVINVTSGVGELVLTTLGRTGSPLLRYRTGDLVRPEYGPCICGRHDLALPGGILGRTDDMLFVRGVNVFPSAIDDLLRAHGDIAEYRVEVDARPAMAEMTVLIEPAGQVTGLAERVEAELRAALSLRVPVKLVPAGSLPRSEMKSRRWVKLQEK